MDAATENNVMHTRLDQFNPFDPEVIETPWDFFAALRLESPVYELPNGAYHLISRYEDVVMAAQDTETFSSSLVAFLIRDESGETQLLDVGDMAPESMRNALAVADPPIHTKHRMISGRTFSVAGVAKIEVEIRSLVNDLIDRFMARGACDWVKEMAVPLPMTMIVHLLGFPLTDLAQLKQWSDHSIALLSGLNTGEEMMAHGLEVAKAMEYVSSRVDAAMANPGGNVVGDLARQAAASGGGAITRDEIVGIVMQLLTAGNETTTSLLGSAMMLMLKTPGLQQQLREEPAKIVPFLEESLRLETPLFGHFRVVKKDTTVAGQALPKGSRVMLAWGAANRDERQFDEADTFRLDRQNPRAHLAFGYGIHHCLGNALARMEARIAFAEILRRTRWIELSADNDFRHVPSLTVRSLKKLMLTFAAN
jgi:cytochrome P450